MIPAILLTLLVGSISAQTPTKSAQKPNIILIVADDLGWDDVSFHGSPQIPTPNIDALALSGVILNNYYVSPSSFATKCELMTGKYATRLGVQHGVIHNKQPVALPENEKILPQYMKDLGYNTHAVGKWSLGFYKEDLLPWHRGFDTFFGGLTSSGADYFTYSAYDENYGLDLRRNDEVIHNETGHYITNIYTNEAVNIINTHNASEPLFLYVAHQAVHSGNADDPLQAPTEYVKKVSHIRNQKRKLFGGMVAALDESLQNITVALSTKGLLENSVIIFTTTAGGAVGGMELNMGSNFPLRGSKMTVWEGGIRGVSFVYSEKIHENSRVNEEMFHATDWLPTILSLAGGDVKSMKSIDGFNVWDAISHENYMSPRFEILHQFDPLQKNQCALRVGDYKLIINQDIGFYGDWYPRPAEVGELQDLTKPSTLPNAKVTCDKSYPHPFLEMHAPPCDPMRKPCLFNIQWDPCEFHNLADFMPNTLKVLLDRLHFYRTRIVKPVYPKFDPKADPEYHDGVWGPWVNVSKFYDEFSNAAFVPVPSPSSLAVQENETHQKHIVHPVAGVMKVINPLASNISLPSPTLTVNKTVDSIIPNAVTASFLPTASAIQPYSPPDTYTNISSALEIPENYTIPSLPTNVSLAELVPSAAESAVPIAVVGSSEPADHISIATENRNASKTQNHEFTNLVGEAVEGGNVGTNVEMKGKTTKVEIVQNETSATPVETVAVMDQLHLNKDKNVTTSGVLEGGLTYSSTTTNTQKNVETMQYETGPINLKTVGLKAPLENVTTTSVVTSLVAPVVANETIMQGKKHALPSPGEGAIATGSLLMKGLKGANGFVLSKAQAGEKALTHYNELNEEGEQASQVSLDPNFEPLGPGASNTDAGGGNSDSGASGKISTYLTPHRPFIPAAPPSPVVNTGVSNIVPNNDHHDDHKNTETTGRISTYLTPMKPLSPFSPFSPSKIQPMKMQGLTETAKFHPFKPFNKEPLIHHEPELLPEAYTTVAPPTETETAATAPEPPPPPPAPPAPPPEPPAPPPAPPSRLAPPPRKPLFEASPLFSLHRPIEQPPSPPAPVPPPAPPPPVPEEPPPPPAPEEPPPPPPPPSPPPPPPPPPSPPTPPPPPPYFEPPAPAEPPPPPPPPVPPPTEPPPVFENRPTMPLPAQPPEPAPYSIDGSERPAAIPPEPSDDVSPYVIANDKSAFRPEKNKPSNIASSPNFIEPPPPAPPAPVAPEPQVPVAPPAPSEPAPPPVPVAPETPPEPSAPAVPPKPEPEVTEPAVKPGAPISPYDIAQPSEVSKPVVPETPAQPAVPLPPAEAVHPGVASIRPEDKESPAETSGKTGGKLALGTKSNATTEHEVSVNAGTFTEAKTDSKLPALQNPHVIAALTNLAEAGKPGKSGMASEVAIVAGDNIAPAKGEKPIAQNFVKEPKYDNPAEPNFDKPEDPFSEFKGPPPGFSKHESAKTGTSSSAGSTTETETVVGAGAGAGSSSQTKQKGGPKLKNKSPSAEADTSEKGGAKAIPAKAPETKEDVAKAKPGAVPVANKTAKVTGNKTAPADTVLTAAKSANQTILSLGGPANPKPKLESFIKATKPNLANSLKALSLHGPDKGIEVSLATGQHNDLPNSIINGHRTFQSVVDLVSDSSNQICAPGARNCIPRTFTAEVGGPKEDEKPADAAAAVTPGNETTALGSENKALKEGSPAVEAAAEPGTQATSNTPLGASSNDTAAPAVQEAPHKDTLHKFFGSIKVDDKKMFYIAGTASEEKDIIYTPDTTSGAAITGDVKKHNIGFNIMLPSNEVKQVAPVTKFKERSKIESTNKTAKEKIFKPEGHPKSKSEIKKVFDMIAEPARTRKMKVPENPVSSQKMLVSKGSIADEGEVQGDTGDIGATKPIKGSETKTVDITSSDANATETKGGDKKSKAPANIEAGDLGSIVTLVGKVKVDRLSTKRTKHNTSKEIEKKDRTKSDKLSNTINHMKHNVTETNAANIDRLSGPSNSIIVSSVIVVLIASFVVVGMAVVAVVAVVARHCRLGKQMDAT